MMKFESTPREYPCAHCEVSFAPRAPRDPNARIALNGAVLCVECERAKVAAYWAAYPRHDKSGE